MYFAHPLLLAEINFDTAKLSSRNGKVAQFPQGGHAIADHLFFGLELKSLETTKCKGFIAAKKKPSQPASVFAQLSFSVSTFSTSQLVPHGKLPDMGVLCLVVAFDMS